MIAAVSTHADRAGAEAMMSQDDSSTSSDDAPLVTQDSLPEPTKLRDVCRCKNSKCLKRYCVCFERGDACRDTCECVNCENTKDSAVAKQQRRAAASRKRKVTEGGCTCKKSRCLKRYCDCFRAGIKCVAECKCLDCQNGRPASVDQVAPSVDQVAPRALPSMVLPPSPQPLKMAATAPPASRPSQPEPSKKRSAPLASKPKPKKKFKPKDAVMEAFVKRLTQPYAPPPPRPPASDLEESDSEVVGMT